MVRQKKSYLDTISGDAFHVVASFLKFEVAQYVRVSKRFKHLVMRQLPFRTATFSSVNDFALFDVSQTRSVSVRFTSIPELLDLSHLTSLKLYKSGAVRQNLSNLLELKLKQTPLGNVYNWDPITLRVLKMNYQFRTNLPADELPMMPNLTSLYLKNIYTQVNLHMSRFPSLATLHVDSCTNIVVFDPNFINTNMNSVTIDFSAGCSEALLDWMLLQSSIRLVQVTSDSICQIPANVCSLNVQYSCIIDLSFVETSKLTHLDVSYTQLTTPNFGYLPFLQRLDISNNDICDFSFLERLPSLVYLDCGCTDVTNCDAFSCLVHLTDLDLSYTRIKTLAGLPTGLTRLSLRGCKDLNWRLDASKLTQLRCVNLKWTRDLDDISSLQSCESLEILKIANSEVDLKTLSSWLPRVTRVDTKFYNFRKRKRPQIK
jgi:Leucine-rich repeat (LRR) protein